jgi:hypothetical protein
MAKYVPKQEVPRFQWGAETGKLYKWLSSDSKERVYNAFYNWFTTARKREANIVSPDMRGLSEQESDTLASMCADTAEGIASYWNMCDTNRGNRNSRAAPDDHGSTGGRQKNERMNERKNDIKLLRSQQYEQREYHEEEMRKILGVDDIYKEE